MAQPALAPSTARASGALLRRSWAELPVVVRYAVVGGVTQAVYLSTLAGGLAVGAHYLVALVVAQLVAMAFAFPAYRGQVFRADGPLRRQLVAFVGVWWTGAALSLGGVPALVELGHLPPLPAQLLVLVLVVGLSFVGHLRVTFRRRPTS
ncbi:GtrA family protein [Phycicoccus sp. MAQZ13P-2]|uniref:GtrA family protein n=1 Tax=Phycicoccus mangrovi TaxID=2840470 RepID=UPI001C001A8D|nr:GtrA family protein [Phycicoccus mangrovi]MBT9255913.1 GtrA family protein [Phycicoccus mangrovi]MBT9274507.1 GtrA family protein [Phycicoccus mangrovi]